MKTSSLILVAVVLAALPMQAQRASVKKQSVHGPIHITPFLGASIPVGDASTNLNTGYLLGVAADYRMATESPLGFRAEGNYASMGAKGLGGTGVSGKGTDLGGNLNFVFWTPLVSSGAAPYLTSGATYSRLGASASQNGATYTVTENHFGFNAGAGIDVPLNGHAARIDARYKQISTNGASFKSLPITFGLTF